MALIDALRMIAEPLRYLIDRVGRRVDGVERDIADVGNKVDFIHTTAPIVQTASVGQTVVVKAVDENGKPTEWEAKDVSGSAGVFIVHADAHWDGMNETYTYDKTYQEIIDAVKADMMPVLKMWDYTPDVEGFNCWIYYLQEIIMDSLIRFKSIYGDAIKCTVDNEWTQEN